MFFLYWLGAAGSATLLSFVVCQGEDMSGHYYYGGPIQVVQHFGADTRQSSWRFNPDALAMNAFFWAIVSLPVVAFVVLLFESEKLKWWEPVCSSCGYELTGNVSGVCPECGTRWFYGESQSGSGREEG
jgi:hypothetical protein